MYHLHVKFINKLSSRTTTGVLEYIARLGAYRSRADTVRDLIVFGMPTWVKRPDGLDYWQGADSTRNRVNALMAFTIEFAIPRILTVPQQRELAILMAHAASDLSMGDRPKRGLMPLCLAIHEGYGRNPHVHMIISTSIPDGIERSAEVWFKRHNSKNPATGGARRSRIMGTRRWLISVRETWARLANAYMRGHGYSPRIDHSSNKDRGLSAAPGIHLGPSAAYLKRQNRPAPRVQRHEAREAERQAHEQLDAEIVKLNKARRELAAEKARDEQSAALVEQQMLAEMDELIETHPFASSPAEILSTMAWMVTDGSGAPSERHPAGTPAFLAQEAGASWIMRHHRTGVYFARPGLDGLVMVSRRFVVSDSDSDEAVGLGLRLSRALKFIKPMVAAKEVVLERCRSALEKLQLAWPLRQHISRHGGSGTAPRSVGPRK